jgi:hypothetical protein
VITVNRDAAGSSESDRQADCCADDCAEERSSDRAEIRRRSCGGGADELLELPLRRWRAIDPEKQ